jgi:hypothetical protein
VIVRKNCLATSSWTAVLLLPRYVCVWVTRMRTCVHDGVRMVVWIEERSWVAPMRKCVHVRVGRGV